MNKDDYVDISTRVIRNAVLMGVGLYATVWFYGSARSIIGWVLTAFLLSFAVEPIVKFSEDKLKIKSRGAATGLAMLLFIGVIAGLTAAIVPLLVRQVDNIVEQLPSYLTQLEVTLLDLGIDIEIAESVNSTENQTAFSDWLRGGAGGAALNIGTKAASVAFQLTTIGLFLFYMVADGPKLRRAICSRLPRVKQLAVLNAWEIAIDKTGQYFYTRVLLSAASAVVTFVALQLIDMPYALALSLWVGVISQFIPGFGAYIAAVVPIIVALGERGSGTALAVLGILIGYQQIENYIIAPKITSKTMDIHPAIAFGGTMAGASAFGFVGAFMALPVIGVVQAVSRNYGHQYAIVKNELTDDDEPVKPKRKSPLRKKSK